LIISPVVARLMGQPTGNFTRQFLLLDPPVQREPQERLGLLVPQVKLELLGRRGLLDKLELLVKLGLLV